MQITIRGEMTIAEIRQALFEKLSELESDFAIAYSKGATLYVNPTNGEGSPVYVRHPDGREVAILISDGPYKPALERRKDDRRTP